MTGLMRVMTTWPKVAKGTTKPVQGLDRLRGETENPGFSKRPGLSRSQESGEAAEDDCNVLVAGLYEAGPL